MMVGTRVKCPYQGPGRVIALSAGPLVLVEFEATINKNGESAGGPHEAWRCPRLPWMEVLEDDSEKAT